MIYRVVLPEWAQNEYPNRRRSLDGDFNEKQISYFSEQFYNIYFFPNYPSIYEEGTIVDGSQIDTFRFVFVDMDLKDGIYSDKEAFINLLKDSGLDPTYIIDSGNGIHAYWQISDLDAIGYLRLQRRLTRKFNTDEAVGKILQLMRTPNTLNTKIKDSFKICEQVYQSESVYTSEQLDAFLPIITQEDEKYCQHHYEKTYRIKGEQIPVVDKIPLKFAQLIRNNKEVKSIWSGEVDDRSKGDYRVGHIMFANGFSREDALSVLVNTAKSLERAPVHRYNYALNIVEKIWTYELTEDKTTLNLSSTVKEILSKAGDTIKGTRFPCYPYLDNTLNGFRLGHVIGLVAGSGVGKTAMALNMFKGFVQSNPDYEHFFIPLEQPSNEIADRWRTMCGEDVRLHEKVHVMSNYDEDGNFRHLSMDDIKDYLVKFQEVTKKKIGCVVIDHIGALKKKGKNGENQDLMDICHAMKGFAVKTNTMLVMQSQAPREKAGIGDLELNKDAAYGTVYFESYCDYLITIWQPLKRCYNESSCPTVTAYKFCKIRHKKKGVDKIEEDVRYTLYFDPIKEHLREMTQEEEKSFDFFNAKCTNIRKQDRKTDILSYTSTRWLKEETIK